MAKPRTATAPKAVTAERAARLHRLLRLLGKSPRTRDVLMRQLRLDVRGFYRDLEVLRGAGIGVTLTDRRYTLANDLEAAIARLPFPDPGLTLGEALQLAKGRTAAHRRLKQQIALIVD
jgi:hypothetical protein